MEGGEDAQSVHDVSSSSSSFVFLDRGTARAVRLRVAIARVAGPGLGGVARERLKRARDEEALEAGRTRRLLALASEAVPAEGRRGVVGRKRRGGDRCRGGEASGLLRVGDERRGAAVQLNVRLRQRGLVGIVPCGHGAPGLARLAEDEAEEDVDAADGKEEEGRDERELVDAVREDRCADSVNTVSIVETT